LRSLDPLGRGYAARVPYSSVEAVCTRREKDVFIALP
jgi:hypothetical protein